MIGSDCTGWLWKAHRSDGLLEQVVAAKFMQGRTGAFGPDGDGDVVPRPHQLQRP